MKELPPFRLELKDLDMATYFKDLPAEKRGDARRNLADYFNLVLEIADVANHANLPVDEKHGKLEGPRSSTNQVPDE